MQKAPKFAMDFVCGIFSACFTKVVFPLSCCRARNPEQFEQVKTKAPGHLRKRWGTKAPNLFRRPRTLVLTNLNDLGSSPL